MKLAISLARATSGQTSPNPAVGAVLIKDGCLLSTGVHLEVGTPHAEVHAISAAGPTANGATLYVTLEPCSHYGKTPPCAEAIINSGIQKVFVACLDPNPLVAGRGIELLKKAGITVEVGLCEEEALLLNEKFFHFIKTNTPFVTIKAAVTLDGKTATKTGDSKWITSEAARRDVHTLRHENDAILVGINTVLLDNPFLTTRRPQGGKNPIRVILDSHLKIPLQANILQDKLAKMIIFTGNCIDQTKKNQIESFGAEVISFSSPSIDIEEVLNVLGERKIMSLLVEGGSEVHASFIKNKLFQQMIVYIAPKVIGGRESIPFIGGSSLEKIADGTQLQFINVEQIGPDLKITAKRCEKE